MKNVDLIKRLLDYNLNAEVLLAFGDTFDDVSDISISYGGPASSDGETKATTKVIYLNIKDNINTENQI